MAPMIPLSGQSVTLYKDVEPGETTFQTNGKLQRTSDGTGDIGPQILRVSARTKTSEGIYIDQQEEPRLIANREKEGKLNVYEYTGIKFGIESDNVDIVPTKATDKFVLSHAQGDSVEIVVSVEYLMQFEAIVRSAAGNRAIQIECFDPGTEVTIGARRTGFIIPETFNGVSVSKVTARLTTAGDTNDTVINLRNSDQKGVVISEEVLIPSGKDGVVVGGLTPAVALATGDFVSIDVDSVSDTKPIGLLILVEFTL